MGEYSLIYYIIGFWRIYQLTILNLLSNHFLRLIKPIN
jgi:hypothetical protein